MPRIGAHVHGESRIRMLRIVRRGDRHDARDLAVSLRFEGAFAGSLDEEDGVSLLPGEAVKNLVYATARDAGGGEIETFGLALCRRVFESYPRVGRVQCEITEQPWARLEAGGKAQGQSFVAASPEKRTTIVTSNGQQIALASGLESLTVLRSSGFAPPRQYADERGGTDDGLQRLLIATLSARWAYTSPDVTFGPYRQGVRAAIVETFGCHGRRSVQHTLYSIADVVLASFEEIAEVTLSVQERPYRPADLFRDHIENPDDLFVALDEPLGLIQVTVERD